MNASTAPHAQHSTGPGQHAHALRVCLPSGWVGAPGSLPLLPPLAPFTHNLAPNRPRRPSPLPACLPGIRELTSVCFRIIEIPERRVGALLGPSGSHIKNLQEVRLPSSVFFCFLGLGSSL